ncbi:MAG TPA: DUF3592 domain-containing protein [Myxococcales bacterium]|nr:DUF3592 domain-containing protein [Myxococcales bacterium]
MASSRGGGSRSGVVVGGLLAAVALFWPVSTVLFRMRAVPAVGAVDRTYPCQLGRRRATCGDVVYTRADGSTGTMTAVQNPGPKGTPVDILYDPGNRDDERLNGPVKLWLGPALSLGVAVFLLAGVARRLFPGRPPDKT